MRETAELLCSRSCMLELCKSTFVLVQLQTSGDLLRQWDVLWSGPHQPKEARSEIAPGRRSPERSSYITLIKPFTACEARRNFPRTKLFS